MIQLARDHHLKVIERPVDKSELFIADEVFLCGTAAQLTPVLAVESYRLSDDRPITNQLRQDLQSVMLGQNPDYEHWQTRVDLSCS